MSEEKEPRAITISPQEVDRLVDVWSAVSGLTEILTGTTDRQVANVLALLRTIEKEMTRIIGGIAERSTKRRVN